VRFYFRTSRSTGVSVGIVGAVVLGILLAATVFWVAVIVGALLIVAGACAGALWVWRRWRL
jgi:hypothetical protein